MTETPATGRRRLLRLGAVLGLATAGAATLRVPRSAFAKEDTLETARRDVQAALDAAQVKVNELGDKVDTVSRETYEAVSAKFDDLVSQLKSAASQQDDGALKRLYRDIQHSFDDIDLEIDRIMTSIDETAKDAWHAARNQVHEVHQQIDHLLDGLP